MKSFTEIHMQLIRTKPWGDYQGEAAELFRIIDPDTNFSVDITDFGATLVRVKMPDKNGVVSDINFGQDQPALYPQLGGYLGANVGRVANRISNGKFDLDGKTYKLFINNANLHSLHGGKAGFNVRFWKLQHTDFHGKEAQLKFSYDSIDGEEGYPGTFSVELTYFIAPMRIGWEYKAKTDKPTLVNLTNHAYWNLEGLDALIDDTTVKMFADRYMPGDSANLPTGEVVPTKGMALDLSKPKSFKTLFETFGDVDNNFFLTGYTKKKVQTETFLAAEFIAPKSGRTMKVHTTEPCAQIYTGNYMANIKTCFGKPVQKHSGFCIETQKPPNAINTPAFREMVILRPEQTYYHKTIHEFGINQ